MADPHPIVAYSKRGKFEDVRDDLKLAIEGKGLVIDYHSFLGRMLERTGKDVGSGRKLYADAEAFVFWWCTRQPRIRGPCTSLTSGRGGRTAAPPRRQRSRKSRRCSTASRGRPSACAERYGRT